MPIPLPSLDDRTFADLVEEMRALIPRYTPTWTDHNASDPGIMLIELFAWLTEALIYRLNRIPYACRARFLELLGATLPGEEGVSGGTDYPVDLDEIRARTVKGLKKRWRAITAEDFEKVVMENEDFNIARVKCLPELDLEFSDTDTPRPGHVSIIVVPRSEQAASDELINDVAEFLDERRLITCRHHVVKPGYTDASIRADVVAISQVEKANLQERIIENLKGFFHPLKGGPGSEQQGWPFGRDIYASEVYEVIEGTEGVEHVESLTLCTRQGGDDWVETGDRVVIGPNNLVNFVVQKGDIKVRGAH
jgi:hypothetical protein